MYLLCLSKQFQGNIKYLITFQKAFFGDIYHSPLILILNQLPSRHMFGWTSAGFVFASRHAEYCS